MGLFSFFILVSLYPPVTTAYDFIHSVGPNLKLSQIVYILPGVEARDEKKSVCFSIKDFETECTREEKEREAMKGD